MRNLSSSVRLVLTAMLALTLQFSVSAQSTTQDDGQKLDTFLLNKEYPQLELALQNADLAVEERVYFEGALANRLNQIAKSLALLEPLVPHLLADNAQRGEVALCTVADDYAKEFRYGDAATMYTEAESVAKQHKLTSGCDEASQASRWSLFRDAPPQTVSSFSSFTVQGKWDSIGLIQIPVSAGAYSGTWIVDTGANLSMISESVAERIGVQISSEAGTAEGAGASVSVHPAVIPELRIGVAEFHNVPVLVASDSSLEFPNINYHIDGGVGISALAALRSFTVYRDGRVEFDSMSSAPSGFGISHNLFLEKFTPVISADFGLGNRLFTIDTGAIGTILSSAFYRENTSLNSTKRVQLELAGAGGTLVTTALQLEQINAELGGGCAEIPKVQVLIQPLGNADEFYGNIGENAFTSFNSFTFDFTTMHFSVQPGSPGCKVGL